MPTGKYTAIELKQSDAFINKESINKLQAVDVIVFDCDGVLTDISDSYNTAISKTAAFIIETMTGLSPPDSVLSSRSIQLFRRAGGFNNDWDIVYGILMFVLWSVHPKLKKAIKESLDVIPSGLSASERLSVLGDNLRKRNGGKILQRSIASSVLDEFEQFARELDETGARSVDRALIQQSGKSSDSLELYERLRSFLGHGRDIDQNIVGRVFEEFLCGSDLFSQVYDLVPHFSQSEGLIEQGSVVITPSCMDRLESILGAPRFGIASGSRQRVAEYLLEHILTRFESQGMVFLDQVENAEQQHERIHGQRINLKKPHPYSLERASRAFSPFESVLFVGDSMADLMMVSELRKQDPRFSFGGIYSQSGSESFVLNSFLDSGCDAVLPTVNELPAILERVRGEPS